MVSVVVSVEVSVVASVEVSVVVSVEVSVVASVVVSVVAAAVVVSVVVVDVELPKSSSVEFCASVVSVSPSDSLTDVVSVLSITV